MLSELTKLEITTMHCKHLSTHMVTGDSREDALVRPGYEPSVTTLKFNRVVYTQLIVKRNCSSGSRIFRGITLETRTSEASQH